MELIGAVTGPATEIAKCCAPYLRRKIDFVFYKRNVRNLKNQLDKLGQKKTDIVERLDLAERQHLHKPKQHVANWLNKVQILETETSSIDWEEGNQICFMGICVDWINRYKLNKVVQQKDSEVRNLIEEVQEFEVLEISIPPLAPPVEQMNIYGYIETDSSNFLIQKISELVATESVKAIGLWGMGGAGKTTLVKRINNQLKSNSTFDKVIMVTMSSEESPDWKEIHKQIAERIGLDLIVYENEDLRVNMLSMALKKEKSLLFIVDNVWTSFDMSLLGLSDGLTDVKSKIIITTRMQSVCDQMGIGKEEQFELKPMPKDDSWKLFQAKAGYVANLAAIEPIAMELCEKCGGSPLAICTLASALRGDTEKVSWNEALRALSSSDESHLRDILKPVFTSIELSFNRLASEDVKLCFLYCCSYPEGEEVLIEDITVYGISQRVIREKSLTEARGRVDAFIEVLRKNSLLILGDNKKIVLVHDIVRKVGLWIASDKKYGYGFVVKSGQQLDELPVDEILVTSKYLSLLRSKINKLPNMLPCPNLLALQMCEISIGQEIEIHEEFFAKTKQLRYLDMTSARIGVANIPNSFSALIYLRALDVRGLRNLSDISFIGKLECLEILLLDSTGIHELPKELSNLKTLRMFHLNNTPKLKCVPPNIFNQLGNLQELSMNNSFDLWELDDESGVNASLGEIFSLSQLSTLNLDIYDPLCLEHNYMCASLSNLEKFKIVVATSEDSINTERIFMRYLSLASIPFRFGNWICKLFEMCDYLNLDGSDVVENLPYQQIIGFNSLTELRISNFGMMKHVIDCQLVAAKHENDVFPSLEYLVVEDMDSLESVCNTGSVRGVFFSKLTHIQIQKCKNLKILFKGSMDQVLQNLMEIQIHGCDELNALSDVLGQGYFQKLKKIEVQDCENLGVLLAAKGNWGCLETISVIRCRNLQNIFHKSPFPQNLKHLTVEECKNIKSVSSLLQPSFSTIETIKIVRYNPGNEEYLLSTSEIANLGKNGVFENLRILDVRGFDGKGIFNGPMSKYSLQNLEEVTIRRCHNLISFWGSSETFVLVKPTLKTLTIVWCDNLKLEEVFLPNGISDEFALRVEGLILGSLSQLTTLKLIPQASLKYVEALGILGCENLMYLLPRSDISAINHLTQLTVYECSQLENIIIEEAGCGETTSLLTNISHLHIENCSKLDLEKLGSTCASDTTLTVKRLPQLKTLIQLQSLYTIGRKCEWIKVLECKNLEKLSSYEDAYILNDYEKLCIYDCPKLLTLIGTQEELLACPSTQSTFRNLKILFIGDCHNLKNIFSISMAHYLVYLERLFVVNCAEITEIVAFSNSVESEVVYGDLFPRLKYIVFMWLPKLECFCTGNPTLMFTSLKGLFVWESPNLIALGMGPSSAPNLDLIVGEDEWLDNFEKDSSSHSRLRSFISTDTRPIVVFCSHFDSHLLNSGSDIYSLKLLNSDLDVPSVKILKLPLKERFL